MPRGKIRFELRRVSDICQFGKRWNISWSGNRIIRATQNHTAVQAGCRGQITERQSLDGKTVFVCENHLADYQFTYNLLRR